jgi:hypothetical protein
MVNDASRKGEVHRRVEGMDITVACKSRYGVILWIGFCMAPLKKLRSTLKNTEKKEWKKKLLWDFSEVNVNHADISAKTNSGKGKYGLNSWWSCTIGGLGNYVYVCYVH